MRRRFHQLHRLEDALLVVLLCGMIGLASTQIVLRNLLDLGLVWIDPMLRCMVLWLGMVAAGVASRENRHIRIDILSRFSGGRLDLAIQGFVAAFSACVCLLIAWHGAYWIRFEYLDRLVGFAGIPVWQLEIVIPLSFTLMGARYGLAAARIARYFYRRASLHAKLRYRLAEADK